MAEIRRIYKCQTCENIVEAVRGGFCEMACCDKPMHVLMPNTVDASSEKHVPLIEKTESGYCVRIGAERHPMIPEHHIEWIELIAGDRVYRRELRVGDEPEAEFCISTLGENVEVRAYCNLHDLWSAKI